MEPYKINDYAYISLFEYNGKYRIEQGRPGKDGKWWGDRVIPLKWDKEQSKRVPADKEGNAKVQLGTAEQAKEALILMLLDLTGERYAPVVNGPHREDEPPF